MSEYAIVAPEDFDQSVFRLIGKEWMLVTAKNQEGKWESRISRFTSIR